MSVTTLVTTKLLKRGDNYYLRYRTPKHIQALGFPREVVKSLKTRDHIQAQSLVLSKIKVMERIYMASDVVILHSLFNELSDFSHTDQLKSYQRESAWEFLSDLTDHIRDCMEDGCTALDSDVVTELSPFTTHKSPLNTQIPEGRGRVYDLLLTLLEAHMANAVNGRSDDFHSFNDRAKSIACLTHNTADQVSSISVFEVFDEFLAEASRKVLSQKMQEGYARTITTLKVLTNDMPIAAVKRNLVREWLIKWQDLPKRNLSLYKNIAIEDLIEMDIPLEHLVSPNTVDDVRKTIQGIFALAVANNHIEVSPASDLKLKLTGRNVTYARFTDEEVQILREAGEADPKIQEKPWRKWIPLLASYTGARRGELVALDKSDVILDDDSGRYYFSLKSKGEGTSKSNAAKRRVPMHCALIDAGFLRYVEALPTGRVFPELKPSQVTSWFNRLKDSAGIDLLDDNGNRKVFHSYRHTVITKVRSKGVTDQLMQPVVGHEVTKTITDRYSHLNDEPISTFFPVIDAVKYG